MGTALFSPIFIFYYFVRLFLTTHKTRFVNMSNRGLVSAPKAKQKRARRLLANRVSAGNTSRKSAHAVYRAFFCARAIAAQWSEPRVGFRTESQTKKSPKALFCLVLPLGIEPGTAP